MLKRLSITAALLLFLIGAARAQAITIAPDTRYNAAIVPGSIAILTLEGGQVFTFGTVFRGTAAYQVITMPANIPIRTLQVWQNKWMVNFNIPSLANVSSLRVLWPGHDVTVPLVGVNTPAPAKPTITATGKYSSFQNPIGEDFNGSISFGPSVGVVFVGLIGSDFGNIKDWVIEIVSTGNDLIEMPARAFDLSQAGPAFLDFLLPRLVPGVYSIQARALNSPGIVSNVITLTVI